MKTAASQVGYVDIGCCITGHLCRQ